MFFPLNIRQIQETTFFVFAVVVFILPSSQQRQ